VDSHDFLDRRRINGFFYGVSEDRIYQLHLKILRTSHIARLQLPPLQGTAQRDAL
jgi:hypothetical protein